MRKIIYRTISQLRWPPSGDLARLGYNENMNQINKTDSGTFFVEGVEYNDYPPPEKLIKVMKKSYAEEFISKGTMRFGSLESYRKWENKELGDVNDGIGMYAINGHEFTTGSANEVFAWCASKPSISSERVLEIAKESDYECIVEIISPIKLIRRIVKKLHFFLNEIYILHCGSISYDRGSEIEKQILNSQKFHYNVFQKRIKFCVDKEYRLSITNYLQGNYHRDSFFVHLGNCSDIVQIKDLPIISNGFAKLGAE
jgi:hypothetical protein